MSETITAPVADTAAPATAAPPLLTGAAAPVDGTSGARDWLPEAYRANPMFKDIPDVAALAKGFENSQRLVGADKATVLRMPADGDDAAMAALFTQLGRPEKPEGYEFAKLPGDLIEGVEPAARAEFHKLGLSAKQASGVMALYGGQVTAAEAARLAKADAVEAAVERDLKAEWGAAFEDRLHSANRAISEIGGKPLGELMQTVMADGTRLGQHPLLIKAWAEIGKRIGEPSTLRGGSGVSGGGQGVRTPDEARAEIGRLQKDSTFFREFADPRNANYITHKATWDRLHAEAYPPAA